MVNLRSTNDKQISRPSQKVLSVREKEATAKRTEKRPTKKRLERDSWAAKKAQAQLPAIEISDDDYDHNPDDQDDHDQDDQDDRDLDDLDDELPAPVSAPSPAPIPRKGARATKPA